MLALESSGLNSFSKIEVCVVVGYGPNEGDGEEGDRFWNDMDRTLYNVRNRYRLCIVGRLNVWIGDRTIAGITGAFGVPGENDDGRRVVEFCAERVARRQDGVEVKSMIDLMVVKRDMLQYVKDVRVVRGMGRGLSDHYVVLWKVRLAGAWVKKREVVVRARRIRSEKLKEHQYREEYARSLERKGIEWD